MLTDPLTSRPGTRPEPHLTWENSSGIIILHQEILSAPAVPGHIELPLSPETRRLLA